MIYIIEHVEVEGPGTIVAYLKKRKIPYQTIALYRGDSFPQDLSAGDAVVCMGGPMNVYEEDKHSFLKEENKFIQKVLKKKIPYLGICLGSQLLAKAAGGKVIKSPVKEVGWFKVDLKNDGLKDPLFKDVPRQFDVYHWHEDMFEIPQNGVMLATASGCPNQAFKVGENAYGLQFHVEVTEKIIRDWCENYYNSHDSVKIKLADEMLAMYRVKQKSFDQQSEVIYRNFEEIVKRSPVAKPQSHQLR